MKIVNTTKQIQELELYDRDNTGNFRSYSVYLQAKGSTDIEPRLISPRIKSMIAAGILSVANDKPLAAVLKPILDSAEQPKVAEKPVIEEVIVADTQEDIEEEVIEEIEEEITEEVAEVEEAPSVEENKKVEEEVIVAHSKDGFFCPHCGKEFASERGLQMHITKAHSDAVEE